MRLPVDNIEGVAEAGRGHRMRASGTAGVERLPDLLAVSSALSQAVPLPPSPLAGLDEAFRHSHNREQRIRELARTVLGVELDSDLAVMEFFAAEYGYTPADYEELSDRQILLMIQQRIRREQGSRKTTLDERVPAEAAPNSEPPPGEGDAPPAYNDSAYRPAKEFLDTTRVQTYKQLHAVLEANPWIRWKKPSPQRLEIHAGDWQAFRSALDTGAFEALNVSAERMEDFLAETRQRQEEVRQSKTGK